MVVFRDKNDTPTAIPWFELVEAKQIIKEVAGIELMFDIDDSGELSIIDQTGFNYPFYFEMWFSFSAQHEGNFNFIST